MSMRVSIAAVALAFTALAVPAAFAHDYPTADRVQYVLECMYRNGGSSVYVYKCSCVIDSMAQKFTYDEWVDASAIARYQGMPGEGMGLFRDAPEERAAAQRYRDAEGDAKKLCGVPK
jgi:hypothetical protein